MKPFYKLFALSASWNPQSLTFLTPVTETSLSPQTHQIPHYVKINDKKTSINLLIAIQADGKIAKYTALPQTGPANVSSKCHIIEPTKIRRYIFRERKDGWLYFH